jgi:16S rRNA (uracil1498-N3)-methyltransferase
MTRPLFLLPPGGLDGVRPGQEVRLDGDEGRHAAGARRIRSGEQVDVGDGAGRVAGCEVLAAGRDGLRLRALAVREVAPPSPRLVLVQALAKGGRDEQAVQTATELGVDAVVPWQAARSVVQWPAERAARGAERWRAVARAATKQSRRAWLPQRWCWTATPSARCPRRSSRRAGT